MQLRTPTKQANSLQKNYSFLQPLAANLYDIVNLDEAQTRYEERSLEI